MALAELFQFGHTQSDDVRAKKKGPAFIQNVKKLLRDHDVVIADKLRKVVSCILPGDTHQYHRNNHLHMHRRDLRDVVKARNPKFAFSHSIGHSTFLTRRSIESAQTASWRAARTTKRCTATSTEKRT